MDLVVLRASDTNELAGKLIRDIVVLNKRVNGPLKSCSIKNKKYKKKPALKLRYLSRSTHFYVAHFSRQLISRTVSKHYAKTCHTRVLRIKEYTGVFTLLK